MAYTNKTITVPAGQTGVFVKDVTPGRLIQLGVQDEGTGGVYNIVNYLYTIEKKAARKLHVSEADLSGNQARSTIAGFVQIGIEVTTISDGDIVMEFLECKT